jgi:hypothetical protein
LRALVLALLCAGGCETTDHVYACTSDANCTVMGVQGRCLAGGAGRSYCAFGDSKCPSGYRWDDSAPKVIDQQCVLLGDGGTD